MRAYAFVEARAQRVRYFVARSGAPQCSALLHVFCHAMLRRR